MDAVVSLISGGHGFLLGAVGQIALLKQFTDKPAVLMVEAGKYSDGQRAYLDQIGWQVQVVKPLRSKWTRFLASRWPNTFTKLRLWELTEYDTVLYLDADAYPFASLDVFDQYRPEILAATHHPQNLTRFRSGLMIVRPSAETMKELLAYLTRDPSSNDAKLGDQGLLNIAFGERWQRLPFHLHTVDWRRRISSVTVGHLRPKPWDEGKAIPPKMRPYTARWKQAVANIVETYGPVPRS